MSILPYALGQKIRQACRPIVRQLMPSSCLLCGSDSIDEVICDGCMEDLPRLPAQHCPQCAEPTTFGERCGSCLATPPHFDDTTAVFKYEFPADRIIHSLKYGHKLAIAKWAAHQLAQRLQGRTFDLIVPLPLHPHRLRQRGFNQSAEIARHLEKHLKIPVDRSTLRRHIATPPQAELPLKERHRNVRNAFECVGQLQGKKVLLIDDVMTSGATVSECARMLRMHGASQVSVGVLARALKHAIRD